MKQTGRAGQFRSTLNTTRRSALGCYGGIAKTPHIDRVARSGVVFTNAIVPML